MDFYDLNIKSSAGKEIAFSDLKGKVVLVVNTATQCGLTPQFVGLEKLYQDYKERGFVIIGSPCNQFGGQEPLNNEVMAETCQLNYGVTFPLTEKIKVNGKETHPVFDYLKGELTGLLGKKIKWNFTKFLIDREGNPIKRYGPTTLPADIASDIEDLLDS